MLFRYSDTDLVALLLQTDRATGDSIGNRISQAIIDTTSKEALNLRELASAHVSVISHPKTERQSRSTSKGWYPWNLRE